MKKRQDRQQKITLAVIAAVIVLVGVAAALLVVNQSNRATAYTPVERFSDIHGLAVDPNDPQVLYVGTHHGLIRGVERDGTWSWALVGNYRADFMGFSMHPNGKVFYASGHKVPDAPLMGVARSDDGGFSWKIIALRGKVDFHAMTLSRANPRILYAWYYGDKRFYKSTDEGRSWSNPTAYGLSDVIALATDPNDEQVIWAATQHGLFRSPDGGESFELMSFGGTPVIAVVVDPQSPHVLYVSLESGLQKSTDGGQTWESIGDVGDTMGHLAVDPTNSHVIYAATYAAAIYKSTDGGMSWRQIKQGG
ncbi:MAG: WD40/YVTN/BNR-like repeat-containing protein [Candidatus Bipolaricaulia bacterium]